MSLVVETPTWPLHVLVIDSPTPLHRGSAAEFRRRGISLSRSADGCTALRMLAHEPDAIVVAPTDMTDMPVLDFIEIVADLAHAPVLLGLTATLPEGLVAEGLSRGAAGLVALPLTPSRLASALGPMRRAHDDPPDVELTCGRLVLNVAEHRVLVRGVEVYFSPKEFEVLQYLMLGFPKLVPFDQLVRHFAGGDQEHAIRVRIAVSRIRAKLTLAAPGFPPIIETIRGIGYRIAG